LTPANLARHRTHPQLAFWKMLKIGNDHFEATHLEPKVDVQLPGLARGRKKALKPGVCVR
jgi:murein L,D-transpeptidase YafK